MKSCSADLNYPGAWDLLYRLFGGGQPFDEFQRSFVSKYYPDKLPLLMPRLPGEQAARAPGIPPAPEKKPSFLAKLFGGRRNLRQNRLQARDGPGYSARNDNHRRLCAAGSYPTPASAYGVRQAAAGGHCPLSLPLRDWPPLKAPSIAGKGPGGPGG